MLFLLRQHIGALANRIEEFSFGGAKFVWKRKLEEGRLIIEHEPQREVTAPAQEQLEPPPETAPLTGDQLREKIAKDFTRRRAIRWEVLSKSSFGRVISGLDEVDEILFQIGDKLSIDPASSWRRCEVVGNQQMVTKTTLARWAIPMHWI